MGVNLLVLVHDTSGHFDINPLLDTLEGRCTQYDERTALVQLSTEEEEGINGGFYSQPHPPISTDTFQMFLIDILFFLLLITFFGNAGFTQCAKGLHPT